MGKSARQWAYWNFGAAAKASRQIERSQSDAEAFDGLIACALAGYAAEINALDAGDKALADSGRRIKESCVARLKMMALGREP